MENNYRFDPLTLRFHSIDERRIYGLYRKRNRSGVYINPELLFVFFSSAPVIFLASLGEPFRFGWLTWLSSIIFALNILLGWLIYFGKSLGWDENLFQTVTTAYLLGAVISCGNSLILKVVNGPCAESEKAVNRAFCHPSQSADSIPTDTAIIMLILSGLGQVLFDGTDWIVIVASWMISLSYIIATAYVLGFENYYAYFPWLALYVCYLFVLYYVQYSSILKYINDRKSGAFPNPDDDDGEELELEDMPVEVERVEIDHSNHTEGGSEVIGAGWGLTHGTLDASASTISPGTPSHHIDLFSETMHG